jgi:hypothetical protein
LGDYQFGMVGYGEYTVFNMDLEISALTLSANGI